jgi:histidinol-phosphatase (PHP family)
LSPGYWLAPEPTLASSDGVTAGDPQSRDLPLDAHLHTDQSPDSSVPIDLYAAEAVARGIPEIAITDHVDFDPRDPAFEYTSFADRERVVRGAAERWAGRGVAIRFGVELTFHTSWESDVRDHLARYAYDFVIGSVHDWPGSPYASARRASWMTGLSVEETVAPYRDEVVAAARSGLFDTIGHLDVVKRYLHPMVTPAQLATQPELWDPALRALVESGTAMEVNSSGLRHHVGETYPASATVQRYRDLGGTRVTAGSDAHRRDWFAYRLDQAYRLLAEAGFEGLTFRRGSDRTTIPFVTGVTTNGGHR